MSRVLDVLPIKVAPVGDSLLLSVRPRFASAILVGKKTTEIRRSRPNVTSGSQVYVYATAPIKALLGLFRVDNLITEYVGPLWNLAKTSAALSRREFDEYLHGLSIGHAICIAETSALVRPIPLADLRTIWPGFHPPQSFRYLMSSDPMAASLMNLARRMLPVDSPLH